MQGRAENVFLFLLTCLLRGMTRYFQWTMLCMSISTHMPLARHDMEWKLIASASPTFLLTCLLRGMTCFVLNTLLPISISTHMPLARHDVDQFHAWCSA